MIIKINHLGEKDFVYSSNLNDNFIYKRKQKTFI